jgi:hypothetical protein
MLLGPCAIYGLPSCRCGRQAILSFAGPELRHGRRGTACAAPGTAGGGGEGTLLRQGLQVVPPAAYARRGKESLRCLRRVARSPRPRSTRASAWTSNSGHVGAML